MMNFSKSKSFNDKASSLIPGGAHTYSKGNDQFPELSPNFIVKGKGAIVEDIDGNEFIDWGMGLRSVCLGHAYEPVLDAVREQLQYGVNFTRPSPIEYEVAHLISNIIPCAEMVKFAKNGSDVTTAAVRLARAYTQKDIVVRCIDQPFFSVDDWFIGDTAVNAGVPKAIQSLTKRFSYNDIASLENILEQNENNVACVILEPSSTQEPKSDFLKKLRQLTAKHGVVLIFDEIISGFRWNVGGAQTYYGVTPDLATFGKSMANGFAISALCGKRDLMKLGGLDHDQERVFLLSTTYGGETHSLAAAKKTIEILRDQNFIGENWEVGNKLVSEFNALAKQFDVINYLNMDGVAISPYINFLNEKGQTDLNLRTLFLQETIARGVLIPYISISASHRGNIVDRTLDVCKEVMPIMQKAISKGSTEGLLVGSACKPVFRKYNS